MSTLIALALGFLVGLFREQLWCMAVSVWDRLRRPERADSPDMNGTEELPNSSEDN